MLATFTETRFVLRADASAQFNKEVMRAGIRGLMGTESFKPKSPHHKDAPPRIGKISDYTIAFFKMATNVYLELAGSDGDRIELALNDWSRVQDQMKDHLEAKLDKLDRDELGSYALRAAFRALKEGGGTHANSAAIYESYIERLLTIAPEFKPKFPQQDAALIREEKLDRIKQQMAAQEAASLLRRGGPRDGPGAPAAARESARQGTAAQANGIAKATETVEFLKKHSVPESELKWVACPNGACDRVGCKMDHSGNGFKISNMNEMEVKRLVAYAAGLEAGGYTAPQPRSAVAKERAAEAEAQGIPFIRSSNKGLGKKGKGGASKNVSFADQ